MSGPAQQPPPPRARPVSLWRAVKAVAWSFLGLRKGSEYREDLSRINPLHVIAVGLAGIAVLVAALFALVHWIVAP